MTPIFNNVVYLNQTEVSLSPVGILTTGFSTHNKSLVAIPMSWTLGRECAKVTDGHNNKISIYTGSNQFSSEYLASILNSRLGLRFLLGGTVRKMQTIQTSKDEVTKVPIFRTDKTQQKSLGDLQLLIQALYETANSSETSVMMDIFENIRDGMVLELYFQNDFKQRGISLWKAWQDTIRLNSLIVDISNAVEIYNCIRGLSSVVRNSLKSIQVLKNSPNFKF